MAETQEQIVREAPEIEAYKLGLLQSAKKLADTGVPIPAQMVAEMSQLQIQATDLAQAGIGGYQPYLEQAGYTLGDAQSTIGSTMATASPFQGEAAGIMRGAAGTVPTSINEARTGFQNALGQSQQAVTAASNQGIGTALGQNLSGVTDAARAGASQAGSALQQAGAFGTQTAQQGIAGLAGATGAYDPASAGAYMNQYEDAAVQQAMADIQRAGDIQQSASDAQAVGAGAFGGARQGIADAELSRNILDQQARTAAGMRQQGFESASQRAQQGFEAQQGRSLQASQLTGALGAQGAQSGIAAAQAAGQLGLSGEQMAAANAQAIAQTGMSLQQLQASTGMSAAQLSGQLTSQMGSLGMQGSELQSRIGEGIAGLGTSYGQLNLAQGSGQADLGMRQAALGELGQGLQQKETGFLFDLGKQYQAQDQAELEAKRQTQMETLYEPYQRVGFLSDIYKGAPTSQQSITSSTSPSTSPAQQILGLGVAGLSAAAGVGKSGLF